MDTHHHAQQTAPTLEQLKALGATTTLITAAKLFGLSRATAYRLARTGQFPVPVIRAGNQYRVPVAPIIAALHPAGAASQPAGSAGPAVTGGDPDPPGAQ